ncbi:hypothetical protein SORBI_3004G135500 [Sorghum bicolor]|uniref:Uncharacterized protein n=1 Tax=Sorghum bicolor TaxID=4558 RepID=C5Y0N8_SORBI|nr:hypothetical protein SORBI_3004G135500 [Sorghum bicolor]
MYASLTHAQSPPITGIEESPQSPRSPCATSLSPLHRCRPHLPLYRLPAAAAPCWCLSAFYKRLDLESYRIHCSQACTLVEPRHIVIIRTEKIKYGPPTLA